jgi:F0F1-type ATP synthase assembly protein I
MSISNQPPRLKKVVDAADGLSLGISIVVAILLGIGIGFGLRKLTGAGWVFWIGVFIGVAAAILNVYKAYKAQKASLDELKNDPRYARRTFDDDEDDDT